MKNKKNSNTALWSSYPERKYVHESRSSSVERTSHLRGSKKQGSSYENEIQGRDQKRLRSNDYKRSEHDRKYYERHSRRRERSNDRVQRSDSSYRRGGCRDRRCERKFRRSSREDRANGEPSRCSNNKEENVEHHVVNGEQEDGSDNLKYENSDRNDEEFDDSQDGTNNDMIYPMVHFPLPRICPPIPRPPILLLPPLVPPRFRIWPPIMQRYPAPRVPFPRPMFVRGPYPPLRPTF